MKKTFTASFGSSTARGGFRNEDNIVRKFNNWNRDRDAQEWLKIMGYELEKIERVIAVKVHGYKTDVQVKISILMRNAISAENISVKLVSNPKGFNQVDKRWVEKYKEMWNIPDDVVRLLKLFTGQIRPRRVGVRDSRRMFFDEMTPSQREKVKTFFSINKILVISDILKGRGILSAGWMLVVLKARNRTDWCLKSINEVMNTYGEGDVCFTPRGSMNIGKITMQRKGGDAGRDTAKMLQFKINPVEIFD